MKPKKMYRDENWLREQYVVGGRTMTDIANEFGITAMSIQNWLDKYNIPTRPRGVFKNGIKATPRHRGKTVTILKDDYDALLARIKALED
jgi:transposase